LRRVDSFSSVRLVPPEPPLADGSLCLRPLSDDDTAAIDAALRDAEIRHWFDDRGYTARDVLERSSLEWERSESATFAILEHGRCVGSVWLDIGPSGRASVGYWLLEHARGRGLVTRALALVAGWAFSEYGVKRLSLLADPRNEASLRVAERAGFTKEGVLRSWADVNGERVDHVSYSLLPSDGSPK
jgi:[ribosomal protein S5]-alanine N-acetyltransferase